MILPIVAYGHPTLKKVAEDVTPDYSGLKELIENMWDTMYADDGIGLAAPQVNHSVRIFVIDASHLEEKMPKAAIPLKNVFINAHIIEEEGELWPFSEGCLSIPDIHEDVMRKPRIRIQYVDENFVAHDEWHDGVFARVIQHEYDHLDGYLFIDRLSPLRKIMLKRKLSDLSMGKVKTKYKMIFPAQPKGKK